LTWLKVPYVTPILQKSYKFEVAGCSAMRHPRGAGPDADYMVMLVLQKPLRVVHAWPTCEACADRMETSMMEELGELE
jgi:hypothetical protein